MGLRPNVPVESTDELRPNRSDDGIEKGRREIVNAKFKSLESLEDEFVVSVQKSGNNGLH